MILFMIEINLIPGARKAKRSRSASIDFRALVGDLGSRIRDPWLITAVVGVVLGLGATGFMFWKTNSKENALTEELQKAVEDSTKNAAVIRERTVAEAQRDSVTRQIAVIRAIDASRFTWPHVMDEISRALPPYTWIKSIQQTSAPPAVPPEVEAGVTKGGGAKSKAAAQAEADEAAAANVISVRLVGQTVDIQALTRFVRQLAESPWLDGINLSRTEDVLAQPTNKEVKEFTIEMKLRRPDSTQIHRVPLVVGVR
jgi:Tfp pilus assembly protein PilN